MKNIKEEIWNKKKVFVVRENGNLIHWVNKKNSGFTLKSASDHYKRNGTFSKDYTEHRERLHNVIEITRLYKKKPESFPKGLKNKNIQSVAGTYSLGRDGLFARSNKRIDMGKERDYKTLSDESENNFYKRVHQYFNPAGYDVDEGFLLVKQNNIKMQRGFIWYQMIHRERKYLVQQNKKYRHAR